MSARRDCLRLLILSLLAMPSPAFAHRLDEYLQATIVEIDPDAIRLQINLTPGVDVADRVLALIDRDRDGAISPDEAAAYSEKVRRDLAARVDGRDVELKCTRSAFPTPAELRTGSGIINLEFSALPATLTAGVHRFTLENVHMPAVGVYLFNAARPRVESIRINLQTRNETQSVGRIEFTYNRATSTYRPLRMVGAIAALAAVVLAAWRPRNVFSWFILRSRSPASP